MGTRELLSVIRYPTLQALHREVLINFAHLTNTVTISHFLIVRWQLKWLPECLEILLCHRSPANQGFRDRQRWQFQWK